MRMESLLYEPILKEMDTGLEGLSPEDFRPCKGTVLAVTPPPKKESKGGIILPDGSEMQSKLARVVAVPDDPLCPCKQGDAVIIRDVSTRLAFDNRQDLAIFQYTDDASSEILGIIPKEIIEEKKVFDREEELAVK